MPYPASVADPLEAERHAAWQPRKKVRGMASASPGLSPLPISAKAATPIIQPKAPSGTAAVAVAAGR